MDSDKMQVPRTSMRDAMEKIGFRYAGINGPGVTNLDNSIEPENLDEIMRGETMIVSHSAMNFHGYVWFNGKDFCEEVWQWNRPVKVLRGDTLREVTDKASEAYGRE